MGSDLNQYSWPGWDTVGILGKGGFGAVYEIHRQIFDTTERAAMKVISIPQSEGEIAELYNDGYTRESIVTVYKSHLKRIVDEYAVMRLLSGYPNIVSCDDVRYETHEDGIGWDIYIKMELLTPLAKALPKQIPETTVIKLAKDLCKALEACQEHKLLHRDIKPQNIFVAPDGTYKLGDFGIAKTIEKTTGGTKIGTYRYMAPEVYNNKPYGMSADIYSLGLVLYWLLNERRMPFLPLPPAVPLHTEEEKAKERRFSGEPLPAPTHGSPRLQQIVLKACAFDPANRYHSAAQLRADLEALPVAPVAPVSPPSVTKTAANCPHCGKPLLPNAKFCKYCGISSATVVPAGKVPASASHGGSYASSSGKQSPAPKAPEEEKKKKRALPIILGIVAILCVAGILINLFLSPPASDTPADWSQWTDTLPDSVSSEDYIIEEQTLYRTRSLETTTSDSPTLEGWEAVSATDGEEQVGQWSDWTEEKPVVSENLEFEEQTRYRYREKETTTGSSSTKSGWTLDESATTYTWGNYGSWSSWSTSAVSNSDSRKVETKTQYRYRNISYSTEYTSWSSWSSWSFDRQSTSDLKKEDSRYVYGYYYYTCPNCGAHMHGWNMYCPTWAGGCGKGWITENMWTQVYSTTSWDAAGLKDWHGTGKYYTYIDGQLVFKWTSGGSGTQYRYATRSTQQVANYGSWSSWGDTYYSNSSTREVQTRTVYRYCDRSKVATYHFWRWKDWEDWAETKPAAANNREIEEKKFYRTRSHTPTKVYHFQRWTDWTDWSNEEANDSDTLQVEKIIQYRYKPK